MFGYGIDRQKIQAMMLQKFSDEGVSELAITCAVDLVLKPVDTGMNPVAVGELDGCFFVVIAFGDDSFGDDYEELKKKKLFPPKYLNNYKSLFYGPTMFNCFSI